jgi:aldose sugar dehydrogenase
LPRIHKAILISVLSISVLFLFHNILIVNGIPALKDRDLKSESIAKAIRSPQDIKDAKLKSELVAKGLISPPAIKDAKLKLELVAKGLNSPTSIAFLAKDDVLVLEKDGIVRRIIGNNTLETPVLDITSIINSTRERGLLGIAISTGDQFGETSKTHENDSNIYLYYTENTPRRDLNNCNMKTCQTANHVVNSLYSYKMKDGRLVNPKLLISIPVGADDIGLEHIGGKIILGPDNKIYVTSGDGYPCRNYEDCKKSITKGALNSKTANKEGGRIATGAGGILVVTQDGKAPTSNHILGDNFPLNLYYAYGIRNSFGLDFDPITGYLWDTENGPFFGDEINLVKPGFNSGWAKVQGVWPITNYNLLVKDLPEGYYFPKVNLTINEDTLFDFNGNGKYSPPKFIWNDSIGVTAIKFFNSDKFGSEYKNDMFVGTIGKGFLYHFDLNKERNGLLLGDELKDNVAFNKKQLKDYRFGSGFYGITDLEVSPDGFLYVVSISDGEIWRIVPSEPKNS